MNRRLVVARVSARALIEDEDSHRRKSALDLNLASTAEAVSFGASLALRRVLPQRPQRPVAA
jgi:hypothetical protein